MGQVWLVVLDSLGQVWRWVHRVWGGAGFATGFLGLGFGLGLGLGGQVICITLWISAFRCPAIVGGGHGGGDPSVLDANYPPNELLAGGPLGGGGGGGAPEGGVQGGRMGGGLGGAGGGALGGSVGGGGQVGQIGVVVGGGSRLGDLGCWGGGDGGHRLPLPPLALPLTIPSP